MPKHNSERLISFVKRLCTGADELHALAMAIVDELGQAELAKQNAKVRANSDAGRGGTRKASSRYALQQASSGRALPPLAHRGRRLGYGSSAAKGPVSSLVKIKTRTVN
jgi:hypothetical protein